MLDVNIFVMFYVVDFKQAGLCCWCYFTFFHCCTFIFVCPEGFSLVTAAVSSLHQTLQQNKKKNKLAFQFEIQIQNIFDATHSQDSVVISCVYLI